MIMKSTQFTITNCSIWNETISDTFQQITMFDLTDAIFFKEGHEHWHKDPRRHEWQHKTTFSKAMETVHSRKENSVEQTT